MEKYIRSLLLLSLFLVSCAPRDVALVNEDERPQISQLGRKGKSKDKNANNSGLFFGHFALSAQLIERQAEALQVLRWALFPQQRGSADLFIQRSGEGTGEVLISVMGRGMKRSYQGYDLNRTEAWQIKMNLLDDGHKIGTIAAEGTSSHLVTMSQDMAYRVQAQDIEKKILITPLTENTFRIEYALKNMISAKKANKQDAATVDSQLDIEVKIVNQNEFQVKSTTLRSLVMPGNREYQLTLSEDFRTYFSDCVQVIGRAAMIGNKKNSELVFEDSSIRVSESKWTSVLAECSNRPLIDFTRLVE